MSFGTSIEQCKAFIDCQLQQSEASHLCSGPGQRPFVTISRQTGSGGSVILERLVQLLRKECPAGNREWMVFDRNLVASVLEDHHLPKRLAAFMPEDRVSGISDVIEEVLGLHPSSWTLIRQTAETILHLAELGRVILVGRGANLITHGFTNVVHVRLIGSIERRADHAAEIHQLKPKAALAFVRKEDEARQRYIRRYFKKDINDPSLYHLIINTDVTPYDEAARIICDMVLRRFPKET